MNVLFDLPDVQQGLILSQWIDIEDVARFDSAVCTTRYRSDFLDLIKSPQCVFPLFTCDHDAAADKWVVLRQMSFNAIHWHGTNDPVLRESVLKFSTKTLTHLTVKSECGLDEGLTCGDAPIVFSEFDSNDRLCEALGAVAKHVSQLTELLIFGGTEGLGHWEWLIDVIQANPSLRVLTVDDEAELTHDVMKAICAAPNLTEVGLSCVTFDVPLTDAPPTMISKSITSLDYFGHPETPTPIMDIICRFPNMTVLSGCVTEINVLAQLSSVRPLLTDVELFFHGQFEDPMALSTARNWNRLTRLVLQSMGHKMGGFGVVCSEQTLLHFIEHCPLLQYINMCEHERDQISRPEDVKRDEDEEGDPLLPTRKGDIAGPGSHLQVLRVDSLSAAGLQTVIAQCKHLHTLSICHYSSVLVPEQLPAESVLHLLACSSVRTLHLQNCFRLCDADLLPLCNLEALYLSYNGDLVTDAALVGVASRCPALHTLMVYGDENMTRACVLPILQHCPVLRSLELYTDEAEFDEPFQMIVLKKQIRDLYPLLKVLELMIL